MFPRPSGGTGRLLGYRSLPAFKGRLPFLSPLYQHIAFARFKSSSSRSTRGPIPWTQRYRISQKNARERNKGKTVTLDVNTLGKPGEVLLLPHRKSRRRNPAKDPMRDTEGSSLPMFIEELEMAEEPLEISKIKEQIEGFRSPHQPGEKLNLGDWENLRHRIKSAFSFTQLSDYIREYAPTQPSSLEEVPSDRREATGAWKPGISAFLQTGSSINARLAERVAASKNLKGKEVLVETILRDCWQLGVINEPGQLDILVQPQSTVLFENSRHFSLQELASLHGTKIDVSRSLGLLRITGTQHSCESVGEIIRDIYTRIRDEEVSLLNPRFGGPGSNGPVFGPEFLDWVNDTYSVFFKQTGRLTFRMFYFVENQDQANKARRTLNLAYYDRSRAPAPFCTYMPASAPATVYRVDPEDSTSWFDRKQEWFRWAMSPAQTAKVNVPGVTSLANQRPELPEELLRLLRGRTVGTPSGPDIHETLTASVGKCLFMHQGFSDGAAINAYQLGDSGLRRTFAADVPRLTPFLRALKRFPSGAFEKFYLIRLIPSIVYADILPQLEFGITVKRTQYSADASAELTVGDARAIFTENSVDYLLPECGMDLRFTRSVYRDLLSASEGNFSESTGADAFTAAVGSFLEKLFSNSHVHNDLESLPPFFNIPIPKALAREDSRSSKRNRNPLNFTQNTLDPSDLITGEYIFPPSNDLQSSRIYHYDFHGEKLSYRYCENGPFLPKRSTDLFLSMDTADAKCDSSVMPSDTSTLEDGERRFLRGVDNPKPDFSSFYEAACELAIQVDRSGGKGFG